MKRIKFDIHRFYDDAAGYATELGWMVLYTLALFLLTWLISVIPW